jgi:hypothetical protein
LGGTIEPTAGRWPFMYDDGSRSYPGHGGLGRWLTDIGRFEIPA